MLGNFINSNILTRTCINSRYKSCKLLGQTIKVPFRGINTALRFSSTVKSSPSSRIIELSLKAHKIRKLCGEKGGANGIAIVGNQSAGKTSLLESICGFEIFEKHRLVTFTHR